MLSFSLLLTSFVLLLSPISAYEAPPVIDLVPIRQHIQKRYDPDALNLRNQETFIYGQDGRWTQNGRKIDTNCA